LDVGSVQATAVGVFVLYGGQSGQRKYSATIFGVLQLLVADVAGSGSI